MICWLHLLHWPGLELVSEGIKAGNRQNLWTVSLLGSIPSPSSAHTHARAHTRQPALNGACIQVSPLPLKPLRLVRVPTSSLTEHEQARPWRTVAEGRLAVS